MNNSTTTTTTTTIITTNNNDKTTTLTTYPPATDLTDHSLVCLYNVYYPSVPGSDLRMKFKSVKRSSSFDQTTNFHISMLPANLYLPVSGYYRLSCLYGSFESGLYWIHVVVVIVGGAAVVVASIHVYRILFFSVEELYWT